MFVWVIHDFQKRKAGGLYRPAFYFIQVGRLWVALNILMCSIRFDKIKIVNSLEMLRKRAVKMLVFVFPYVHTTSSIAIPLNDCIFFTRRFEVCMRNSCILPCRGAVYLPTHANKPLVSTDIERSMVSYVVLRFLPVS